MARFPVNRRKFLALAAAGVGVLGADAIFIAPNRLRVVRQDVALARWPLALNGFTIALLSDFHYDPYFSVHPIRSCIDIANRLNADLIALTGDFVSAPWFGPDRRGAEAAEPCADLLKQLRAPHGVWAVLGNHDVNTDAQRVAGALHSVGIQVLGNRSVPMEQNGARFWLSGLDDVLGKTADPSRALHNVPKDEAVVMMVHEPDYAEEVARHPVDLQLSGHTHGGQIRFPFLPPLYLPPMAKKYVWGLYQIGPLTLYTNAGIGTVEVPVRLNCPPEITLLTLRRSAAA